MDANTEDRDDDTDVTKCSGIPAESQEKITSANLTCLPEIVWVRVMSFLPLCDRYHMTVSCDLFRQLFFHPLLWRSVELACFLSVDPQAGPSLTLRPSHRQTAVQLGHLFRFVSLYMADANCSVQEETAGILLAVAERSSLKGLKLTMDIIDQTATESGHRVSVHSGQSLIVNMLKRANSLHHLDLSGWSIFHHHEDQLNVLNALLLSDTCPCLRSLNIASKIMLDTDSVEQFRQMVVRLVFKFVHLRHLWVRQILLSDLLLRELASSHRDRLQTLTVLTCEPAGDGEGGGEDDISPCISHTSWSLLRSVCPDLELHVQAEVAHVPRIRWALKPCVPVVSMELLFCSLPPDLLCSLQEVGASLQTLICHVLPGHSYDLLLTQVVAACPVLRHLVFYGKVSGDTILNLAALPRQWRTFRFRLKCIVLTETAGKEMVNMEASGKGTSCKETAVEEGKRFGVDGGAHNTASRETRLKQLCATVSDYLGYSWKPCQI